MTIIEQMNNYPEVEKMLDQYEAAWNKIWRMSSSVDHYWDNPEYLAADEEQNKLYAAAQKLGWTLKTRNCHTYYASKMSAKRIAKL